MVHTGTARGSFARRLTAALAVGAVTVGLLGGCALFGAKPHPTATHTKKPTPSATPTPTGTSSRVGVDPTPAPPPVIPPTLTPVPAGTVVAQGDVASPKGSIHFHYRVVANGDNTYSAQYSGFTSTGVRNGSVTTDR